MVKPPKVVPITEEKNNVIARDPKTRRIILGIGPDRIAIDFLSRVTRLPLKAGDKPGAVLPLDRNRNRKRKQKRVAPKE